MVQHDVVSCRELNVVKITGDADVDITADVGSIQGGYPLTHSFNVITTSGTAGDAVTLPASFKVGTLIFIKNSAAANSVDVFPALGDDLGGGANTAAALAAGDTICYIGMVESATWESFFIGA